MAEFRQDIITGRRVIVATDRARRPETFLPVGSENIREDLPDHVNNCPFCYGNEGMTPPEKVAWRADGPADSPGWKVRVVPNKFPAVEIKGQPPSHSLAEERFFRQMPGYGEHEVIIENPLHNRHPGEIALDQMQNVLECYRHRYINLAENPFLRSVNIYRNHKKEAGASMEHPHSQVIALPFIPFDLREEIEGSHRFYLEKGRCAYCTMIEEDSDFSQHVICGNNEFVAIVPYAARLPFETWIIPRKHQPSFTDMGTGQLEQLSRIMTNVLRRLAVSLDDPPYNYYIHSAPILTESLPHYHWHLEIFPRLTIVAGFEMASGVYINETVPEESARYLREVKGNVYA